MSTYDGAYSNRSSDSGAKVCCCYEDKENDFCRFHGKYGNDGFKQSDEHKELKSKLNA